MHFNRGPGNGLRNRLRVETADRHAQVEAVVDVPGAIRTRADYVTFLRRLYELHARFEHALDARRFTPGWRGVEIDVAAHRRAHLLADDIEHLGEAAPGSGPSQLIAASPAPSLPPLNMFGQALGCLYVLEGSALGGPVVAGIVQARIGAVPTSFLRGHGRPRRTAWPAVLGALERFDAQGGNGDEVVAGAFDTFAAFAVHLQPSPDGRLSLPASSGSR